MKPTYIKYILRYFQTTVGFSGCNSIMTQGASITKFKPTICKKNYTSQQSEIYADI